MNLPTRIALAALALVAFPLAAAADIPPPEGYVEKCTTDKQPAGLECKSCSAWHGERDACDKTLGVAGYSRMCQTRGASTWSEVWCKDPAKATEPTPTPDKPAPTPDKPAPTPDTPAPTPDKPTTDTPAPATEAPAAKPAASKCAAGGIELQLGLAAALAFLVTRRSQRRA